MSEQNPEKPAEEDVPPEPVTPEPEPQEGEGEQEPDWRKDFNPDKAAERIRKYQSENKNLRDRAKSAEEKAKGVDERDQKITALEVANLRYEVAFDLGLPRELAKRLTGNTKEEMVADADELMKIVGTKPSARKPIEALRGGGNPEQEPDEVDLRKIGSRMFSH